MTRWGETVVDGALVAAAQIMTGELAASASASASGAARSPLSGLGKVLIDALPGAAVDVVVATAGSRDKLFLGASLAGSVMTGAVIARRYVRPSRGALGLAAMGLGPGLASAAQPDSATGGALAAGVASGCAGAAAHLLLTRGTGAGGRAAVGLAAVAAAIGTHRLRRARRAAHAQQRAEIRLPPAGHAAPVVPVDAALPIDGITALFTDPDDFYVTDVQFPAPRLDIDRWRLRVTGMVDHPLEFSFGDLLELPLVEFDATLVCVHNPVGGDRISSGRWLGVPMTALLEPAGVQDDAEQLVARAADGFTAGLPVRPALTRPAFVAVGFGGEPLRVANGYPARLITPGLWGADANTKWLAELELTTWGAVRDYWDRRGWPRVPSGVRPGARIDVPRHRDLLRVGRVTVAGVAWAPPHGVAGVQIAVDGGPWTDADLGAEVSPAMWRHWRIDCDIAAGDHELQVRTVARDGRTHVHREPPYPVGASGQHRIRVRAASSPSAPRRLAGRLAAGSDAASARAELAATGVRAWLERGYPPAPRFPAPPAG